MHPNLQYVLYDTVHNFICAKKFTGSCYGDTFNLSQIPKRVKDRQRGGKINGMRKNGEREEKNILFDILSTIAINLG